MAFYTVHHKGITEHFETYESDENFEAVAEELKDRYDFPITIKLVGGDNETHSDLD